MSSSQEGPVAELDARPRETPGGLAHLGLRVRLLAASARTSTSGRSTAGDTRGIVSGSRRSRPASRPAGRAGDLSDVDPHGPILPCLTPGAVGDTGSAGYSDYIRAL